MNSQAIQYQEHQQSDFEDTSVQIQEELLELLLQPEEEFYPWDPTHPEAEAYFAELEGGFSIEEIQDDQEIAQASVAFFERLNQCWELPLESTIESNIESSIESNIDSLKTALANGCASCMPTEWLEAIASRAQEVVQKNLSLAEQLVLCVKPLLQNWTEDDLLVLARPWAYAMRSGSDSMNVSASVKSQQWQSLSSIQQVRLTLEVAHSALIELNNHTSN